MRADGWTAALGWRRVLIPDTPPQHAPPSSPAFNRSAASVRMFMDPPCIPTERRFSCLSCFFSAQFEHACGEGGRERRGRRTEPGKHNRLKLDEPQRLVNLLSRLDRVRSVLEGGADVESSLITVPPAEPEPMNWVPVRDSAFQPLLNFG